VIEYEPAANAEVVKLADPPCKTPHPTNVDPLFKNSMFPPSGGVPELEATVAVKVTSCPVVDGFGDKVRVVVGGAPWIAWLNALDMLPTNVESPL
jgi:hypothetical protein